MSETDNDSRDERVRRRAYELWEQAGKPEGRNDEFWHNALAEISHTGGKEDASSQNASTSTEANSSTLSKIRSKET